MKKRLVEYLQKILEQGDVLDTILTYKDSQGKERNVTARSVQKTGDKHPAWPQLQRLLGQSKQTGTEEPTTSGDKKPTKADKLQQPKAGEPQKPTDPATIKAQQIQATVDNVAMRLDDPNIDETLFEYAEGEDVQEMLRLMGELKALSIDVDLTDEQRRNANQLLAGFIKVFEHYNTFKTSENPAERMESLANVKVVLDELQKKYKFSSNMETDMFGEKNRGVLGGSDSPLVKQLRSALHDSVSRSGKRAMSAAFTARFDQLSNAIDKSETGRGVESLKQYKNDIRKLRAAINRGDFDAARKILRSYGIDTFKDIMDSKLFGVVGSEKSIKVRQGIADAIQTHAPFLLAGEYDPTYKGVLDSLSSVSLLTNPDGSTLEGVTTFVDDQADGKITLGGRTFRVIELTDEVKGRIEQYLDDQGITNEREREEKRREILQQVESNNQKVRHLEEYGEDGFFELPQGDAGAELLQERLSSVFDSEEDKQRFKELVGAWRTSSDEDAAWRDLQDFLKTQFDIAGVIPAFCEHLKAIRTLAQEPEATVYMPVADNFAIADVIIIRPSGMRLELANVGVDLGDTSVYLGSVKRGERGAPSSVRAQLGLSRFRDDTAYGGSGEIRDTLVQLAGVKSDDTVDTTPDDNIIERAMGLLEIDDAGLDELLDKQELARLEKHANDCMCKGASSCKTESAQLARKLLARKVLYIKLYEAGVTGQGFTNTSFKRENVSLSDGKSTFAQSLPDARSDCSKGKVIYSMRRAYLQTPN